MMGVSAPPQPHGESRMRWIGGLFRLERSVPSIPGYLSVFLDYPRLDLDREGRRLLMIHPFTVADLLGDPLSAGRLTQPEQPMKRLGNHYQAIRSH
jgi:hypothetical protein